MANFVIVTKILIDDSTCETAINIDHILYIDQSNKNPGHCWVYMADSTDDPTITNYNNFECTLSMEAFLKKVNLK